MMWVALIVLGIILTPRPAAAEKMLLWQAEDGRVFVTGLNWDAMNGESEDEFIARAAEETRQEIPPVIGYVVVEKGYVVQFDRYFRESWQWDRGGITIDRAKAEEEHRLHLRQQAAVRRPLIVKDWSEAQALGDSAKADAISAKLSAITTAAIDAIDFSQARTLDELKLMKPEALK